MSEVSATFPINVINTIPIHSPNKVIVLNGAAYVAGVGIGLSASTLVQFTAGASLLYGAFQGVRACWDNRQQIELKK